MKKLLCLFGVLVLVVGCSKEEVDDGAILSVSKDGEAVVQEFDKYFEMDGQDIYMETNLEDVYYMSNGKKYTLKEFVKSDGEFSEIISLLGEGISYDDGGSMLYSSDEYDLSVLMEIKIFMLGIILCIMVIRCVSRLLVSLFLL